MGAHTKIAAEVIACPAGDLISETREMQGPGCHCAIAKEVITTRENSSTLKQFCSIDGDYRNCPVWRRNREAWWDDQHRKLDRDLTATAPVGDR